MSPESGSEVVKVATVESMTIFSLNAVAKVDCSWWDLNLFLLYLTRKGSSIVLP